MIGERISNWLELGFWQLTVRLLTVARPISLRLISRARRASQKQVALPDQVLDFITAIAGWLIGLLIGLLVAAWGVG